MKQQENCDGLRPGSPKGVGGDYAQLDLPRPYLLFLGDVTDALFAKTAFGLRDWAPTLCVGEHAIPTGTVTTGLSRMSPSEAYGRGARALVIGVANRGGVLEPAWIPYLIEALQAGLHLVSGLHGRLGEHEELRVAAQQAGLRLIDVRQPPRHIPVATGAKRSGKRLLTVGTDCALGKKYTALTLAREFKARGVEADFRATGQTGILIAGFGIPMDAVVADFIAGAAEMLSPAAPDDHWDIVEGQGSIFHPSYAGVSLGLLHGTQPDVFVLCHELGREKVLGLDNYRIPDLEEAIDLHLRLAWRTNANARCAGVSLNTARVSETEARSMLRRYADRLQVPVADPMRPGPELDQLVLKCLS